MRTIEGFNKISTAAAAKASFQFGFLFFSIYFGYTYAFTIGAIWVDNEFRNHAYDRSYQAGDIISIFFGVLFGMMSLGGIAPNIAGFAAAKAAGKKAFDIIDRQPQIKLDAPDAVKHEMAGEIKFENVNFFYPSRPD